MTMLRRSKRTRDKSHGASQGRFPGTKTECKIQGAFSVESSTAAEPKSTLIIAAGQVNLGMQVQTNRQARDQGTDDCIDII